MFIFSSVVGRPLAALLLASAGAALAQPLTPPLTLPRAIELALGANPGLAAARREVDAAQAQVEQAGTRPNPELSYLLEDTRAQTRTQTLQVNLPLELGGKRAARIGAAERGRDVAGTEAAERRAELRAQVTAAFFEALAAQQRAALAGDSVRLARQATDAVAKRVLAGKVSPVEETKARVAEGSVRMELAQAQGGWRAAAAKLAGLLGAGPPVIEQVEGEIGALPAAPDADALRRRLATAPPLLRAEQEVARRQALIEVERGKQTPDVTVSVGLKRAAELQRNQAVVGVSVPIPLFDRNQGHLREALVRAEKARDELAATRLRLESELMQARGRLGAAREEVAILKAEVLPGAQRAYEAAGTGFQFGKFGFLDVLDAQRTWFAVQAQYIKASAAAHQAASEIDRVLGDAPGDQP